MLVIDDSNVEQVLRLDQKPADGYGLKPRSLHPEFGNKRCYAAPDLPSFEMEAWPDLISDGNNAESSLWHVWKQSKIGVLNQSNLSYCHAFSPAVAIMIQRELQGLPYVELSASSIGAPVTNYRNAGAWILEDLKQITDVGCATTAFVPMLTTRRGDFKPGWEANAALHKVREWKELESRNFKQQVSALLARKALCNGLNYWGHAVTDLWVVDLDTSKKATDESRYGILFLNSWDESWGDNGCAVRSGRQKYADEAYLVENVTASAA